MLVLSRKVGSRIVVEGNVEIKVVQIRGNHVRLGITAPAHVAIERFELCGRVDQMSCKSDKLTTNPDGQIGCENQVYDSVDPKHCI